MPCGAYLTHSGADNVQSKLSDTVDVVSGNVQPNGLTHFHGLRGWAEDARLPLHVQSTDVALESGWLAGCGDSWTAVPIDAATEACHGDGGGGGELYVYLSVWSSQDM